MVKADPTVKKETMYILYWVIILSILLNAVFLIIGMWGIKFLLGNILAGAVAVLNFFFMGITVQKSLDLDEKEARNLVMSSQRIRNGLILLFAVIGAVFLNPFSSIIPLLFPRIAIFFRMFFMKKRSG